MRYEVVLPGDDKLIAVAREIVLEYQQAIGVDFCFHGFDKELENMPGDYGPPGGQFLLVYDGPRLIACGALRDLGDSIGELKRIYVRPEARRLGLGRQISERLIAFAKDSGYRSVRLDTLRRLAGAIELYRELGFDFIEPYNEKPDLDIVYMEKVIG